MSSGIDNEVTVLVPTSVIPRHPDTSILDDTLASIRFWFPTSWIIIMADGVRPEFESRREQYAEYLRRVEGQLGERMILRKFDHHCHQTTMVINTLPSVTTPLIYWSEHDQPLLTERPIDWTTLAAAILTNRCDLVRLMLMEEVHPAHEYLYNGWLEGLPLRPQKQWSGWSHLASTEYYRRLLAGFDTRAKMTVERYVVRLVEPRPWEENRLTSYIPDPKQAKRLRHSDGRCSADGTFKDPTFEELEVYPPR
jgi:hypothetical protein